MGQIKGLPSLDTWVMMRKEKPTHHRAINKEADHEKV